MNYFFELLYISLGNQKELSGVPSLAGWECIFKEAQRQAIVGVLLDGLEKLPHPQKPPTQLLLQWIGYAQQIEQTNLTHRQYAKELNSWFNSAGFECCVIKGVGTAMYYPNPLRRQGGDIDLWAIGKRREVTRWMLTQCDVTGIVWHHEHANFFKDVEVEVHYHPSWLYNPIHNHRLHKFFANESTEQVVKRDVDFCYPTPVFEAVFSLTHTFHHLVEEGVGLRHVIDYYYIISALSEEERKLALQHINHIGMQGFLRAMMYVLEKVCGISYNVLLCEPDEQEGKYLLNEILAAGNFGHHRKGELLRHNSIKRFWVMSSHYPSEGLWMIPRKAYQVLWRNMRKIIY